jgi:exopolysaccharide biosynthesis WecB/TagA/CpsF family protein
MAKNTSAPSADGIVTIDSWRINVPDQTWAIERVIRDAVEGRSGTFFTINLDHLSRLRTDVAFREAYAHATYISADGVPVVLLARAEGARVSRVTGADLVLPLCRAAAAAGLPVHFFGTRTDVLERAVARLRRDVPTLAVAGCEAPPMGFDPAGEAAHDAARRIAASGARLCFVALGAPKQEVFADLAADETEGVVYLGVGAALDFLAGERRRAPGLLQTLGLEWLWRTLQEPRRLIPRYLRAGLWLIGYVLRLAIGTAEHAGATRPGDPTARRPAPTRSREGE